MGGTNAKQSDDTHSTRAPPRCQALRLVPGVALFSLITRSRVCAVGPRYRLALLPGCQCQEARHLVCFLNQGCRASPCSQNAHCPPYAPGLQVCSGPSTGQGIQQAAAVAGQWWVQGWRVCVVSVLSQLTSVGVSHPNYEPDRAVLLIHFALCFSSCSMNPDFLLKVLSSRFLWVVSRGLPGPGPPHPCTRPAQFIVGCVY